MGGRGASVGRAAGKRALQVSLAISNQWVKALEEAKKGNYAEVHYELPWGKIRKAFWNGASFGDWKSDMALRYSKRKGIYKVKFIK